MKNQLTFHINLQRSQFMIALQYNCFDRIMINRQKISLKNVNFYQIIHKLTQTALYLNSKSNHFQTEKAMLAHDNPESLGQVWLIVQVDKQKKPHLYQIVHARSTLVLQCLRQGFFMRTIEGTEKNQMRLRFGNWEKDQLFYLEQPDPENCPNTYRFRAQNYENNFIYFDNLLRCDELNPTNPKCFWELKQCRENPVINRSCYFQSAFSTLVIDVRRGSLKEGQVLIQYTFNNRFNQRFNIYKRGDYYVIENLNSKMFLGVKKGIGEADVPIIQGKKNTEKAQWWKIQYQGKGLYLVRSVVNGSIFLGIKNNNLNKSAQLVGLWKIIGFLP